MSNINKKSQRLTPESRSNESRLGIDVPDRENDDVSLAIIDKGFGRRTYAQGARRQGLEFVDPVEVNLFSVSSLRDGDGSRAQ